MLGVQVLWVESFRIVVVLMGIIIMIWVVMDVIIVMRIYVFNAFVLGSDVGRGDGPVLVLLLLLRRLLLLLLLVGLLGFSRLLLSLLLLLLSLLPLGLFTFPSSFTLGNTAREKLGEWVIKGTVVSGVVTQRQEEHCELSGCVQLIYLRLLTLSEILATLINFSTELSKRFFGLQ